MKLLWNPSSGCACDCHQAELVESCPLRSAVNVVGNSTDRLPLARCHSAVLSASEGSLRLTHAHVDRVLRSSGLASRALDISLSLWSTNPHCSQIRLYEDCNLTEILQVALFAARDVRDMSTPGFAAVGSVLFEPDLNDKRVNKKFRRRILTRLLRWLRCEAAWFQPHNNKNRSQTNFGG